MDLNIFLLSLPALVALGFKIALLLYASNSRVQNKQTRLFLYFLFVLSLHNLSEVFIFYGAHKGGIPIIPLMVYFAIAIPALALLIHLFASSVLQLDSLHSKSIYLGVLYGVMVALEALLLFTDYLITGFAPVGNSFYRTPGPLYFLFELYAVGCFVGTIGLLLYGSLKGNTDPKKLKSQLMLLGLMPMALLVIANIVLMHFDITWLNTPIFLPITITFFLLVSTYAIHQYRVFDIQFYIPGSKVRKRKTAFYDRIRAMIAEIADLGSVGDVVNRLADTLRCPIALVGGGKPMFALAGNSRHMADIPEERLHKYDHIIVANEIADTDPETFKVMRQHGVAAIVPFYPHSETASSWLLLGDSFSDQVYTPLDFKMVEELFDKMAELFLDKLIMMRTQLADAHRQIHSLESRMQTMESNVAVLQKENESLRSQNMRLVKEQPADSLGLFTEGGVSTPTITLLGRDKSMFKRLREYFPQAEHFVGADSAGFKRKPLPAVMIFEIGDENPTGPGRLSKLLANPHSNTAALLFGQRAEAFVSQNRKALIGSLIEVLPMRISDEAVARKINALTELRDSVFGLSDPDRPLIGKSHIFSGVMRDAQRLAGFAEPVLIKSHDTKEAIAIAAYMHGLGEKRGKFVVLHSNRLMGEEIDREGSIDEDSGYLAELLGNARHGTLMIDDISALNNTVWYKLLTASHEFVDIRLIAGCGKFIEQSPDELLKPLRPLVLEIPDLRERGIDIQLLAHYFTLQFNLQAGTQQYLSQSELDKLIADNQPDNTDALKLLVFNALQSKCGKAEAEDPSIEFGVNEKKGLEEYVSEFEARLIEQTLKRCGGNKSKAARLLGLRPNTLHYKLERYGLLGEK